MSSTSQKHRNFVAEPMGDKPCTGKSNSSKSFIKARKFTSHFWSISYTELAGIGETLGKRLEAAGFDKVKY